MADEKSITSAPESTGPETATVTPNGASEVHINLLPHGFVEWRGTRAQIEDEITVPAEVGWPTGLYATEWREGGFHCALHRCKPDHDESRGHRWVKRSTDLWRLTRTYLPHLHNGFAAARVYQLRKSLAEELWCGSVSAIDQCDRHLAAQRDWRFQALLGRLAASGG